LVEPWRTVAFAREWSPTAFHRSQRFALIRHGSPPFATFRPRSPMISVNQIKRENNFYIIYFYFKNKKFLLEKSEGAAFSGKNPYFAQR
jgi:hypothetical protein